MSSYTPNLQLFKYNTSTDGKEVFSIEQALNHNWDILDNLGSGRNIGEIVASTIPLTDAGLHLLDGSLIQGDGIYSDFVDYISSLYSGEYIDKEFIQPKLTTNGTMGGNKCACDCSTMESGMYAYMAFDGDTTTRWGSGETTVPDWLTFYNPKPLKVSEVVLNFYAVGERYQAGEIQGSNNNETWTTLTTFSGNTDQILTLTVQTNDYYKYIRFYGTTGTGTAWGKISQFQITATYKELVTNYFTDETTWQDVVTSYGVCGKFVYDSVNNTVRLPKVTGIIEGTTDVSALGDLVEAGLPSHTHQIPVDYTCCGADPAGTRTTRNWCNGDHVWTTVSRMEVTPAENSIYGNSDTVQPQTIKVLYYIVVATSTKTNIQVDIDEITTDLNGKADTDLSNVPNDRGILRNSYVSGVIGYRKYSDGFMEAWGTYNGATGATITLPITFSNMNYCLTTANFEGYCIYAKVSVSSISWHDKNVANPTGICWYVCGY